MGPIDTFEFVTEASNQCSTNTSMFRYLLGEHSSLQATLSTAGAISDGKEANYYKAGKLAYVRSTRAHLLLQ